MAKNFLYKKGEQIGSYKVEFPIKRGRYAQTYRVRGKDGVLYFMKVINTTKLTSSQLDKSGEVLEVVVARNFDHPNLCRSLDDGIVIREGIRWTYFVTPFVSSETVSDRVARTGFLSAFEAKEIAKGVVRALSFIHSREVPLIHCEICPENVLIDLTKELSDCKLIDFGHAQKLDYTKLSIWESDTLNPFYIAPEMFHQQLSTQSDLWAVGALLFHVIYGIPPYFVDLGGLTREEKVDVIQQTRERGLVTPNLSVFEKDEFLDFVIQKALSINIDERFRSAEEFLDALDRKFILSNRNQAYHPPKKVNIKHGIGFDDVAGMNDLKEILRTRIIDILKDQERAERYKLEIPNGMLLYGPPGCGKTFIAEKFAEEAGYNYTYVKSSDLASIYVHGSQEKIGALFDDARKNAPTIINFDEFDALVPDRNRTNNASVSGEVNEFLSQLNNCGKDGVFVIASSNRPELIDKAILRRGRIDKIIYVPLPDHDARKRMFEINLKGRPTDFGIDYDRLAILTDGYVSSDISYIVNEAAIKAAEGNELITEALLVECINNTRPSISEATIKHYEELRIKMEGKESGTRRRVGFVEY